MRVLLSTFGSRGDVEPMVGLAMRLQARRAADASDLRSELMP